jgi:hypothetical protein
LPTVSAYTSREASGSGRGEAGGFPGFGGVQGAAAGGVLVAADGLVLLGLPLEFRGELTVAVDLTAHVGRGGFGGPGVQLDVALEAGAAGCADVTLAGAEVEGAGGAVPGGCFLGWQRS